MKNILYTATYYQKIYIYRNQTEKKNIYIEKKIRERKILENGYTEKLGIYICRERSNYKKYLSRKKISSGNDLKYIYIQPQKKKKKK